MREISFKFFALEGSPHITQEGAFAATVFSVGPYAEPVRIVEVFRNGASLKFRLVDDTTAAVSPIVPFEADRIELRCVALNAAPEALNLVPASYSLPVYSYGLQPRNYRSARAS